MEQSGFLVRREPPETRRKACDAPWEAHFTEAAVLIAFAQHLLQSEDTVTIHPDGEHAKRFDIPLALQSLGYTKTAPLGTTTYGGIYRSGNKTLRVHPKSGQGDILSTQVFAEAKGGVINTRHAGQVSRLRKGLSEAVGQLMAAPDTGQRMVAVVPATVDTRRLGASLLPRCLRAEIEIALVDADGSVEFL